MPIFIFTSPHIVILPTPFHTFYRENPAETARQVSFPSLCVRVRATESECVCALVTKTMQHHSRLGNYGHNAGLSCKSSLKQKHTRAEDNNYPSRIMRRLDAQSRLSKHADDRNGGALRLQGVNEICLDPCDDDDDGATAARRALM